jgi:hypothetical protein
MGIGNPAWWSWVLDEDKVCKSLPIIQYSISLTTAGFSTPESGIRLWYKHGM